MLRRLLSAHMALVQKVSVPFCRRGKTCYCGLLKRQTNAVVLKAKELCLAGEVHSPQHHLASNPELWSHQGGAPKHGDQIGRFANKSIHSKTVVAVKLCRTCSESI